MKRSPTADIPPERVDRRQFTTAISGLLAAAVVWGCGASPTSPTNPQTFNSTNTPGTVVGTVAGNHQRPHEAVITAAQLAAAAPIQMDISNGLHSHTVSLTGAQVGHIAAGIRVSVTSSMDPHSNGMEVHDHLVTFN